MVKRMEIRCIKKSNRKNYYERIDSIGGVYPNGERWKVSEATAISFIKDSTHTFFVNQGGASVDVIIAGGLHVREYLKTVPDGEEPNNLLSLPDCP